METTNKHTSLSTGRRVPVSLASHSNANAATCGKNAAAWADFVQQATTAGLKMTSTASAATGPFLAVNLADGGMCLS